jgi:hypothetical protein
VKSVGKQGAGVVLGTVAILLSIVGSLAFAAETTQSEYKEAVEPICKANASANKRILAGVREDVQEGRLQQAASKFRRAGTALNTTYKELRTVPQPEEDAERLTKWLSYVKGEVDLLGRIAKALADDNANKARRLVVKLTVNANLANSQIVVFDLNHCLFKPGQYT